MKNEFLLKLCTFCVFILSLFVLTSFGGKLDAEEDDKWNHLFNGKDLEGWFMTTRDSLESILAEDIFSVDDGVIHVYKNQETGTQQTFAGLFTEKVYGPSYQVSINYKWGKKKFLPRHEFVRDAGVVIHQYGPPSIWPNGIECQIQEGDTGDLWIIGSGASSTVNSTIKNYDPKGEIVEAYDMSNRFFRFHRGYYWEKAGWNNILIDVNHDSATFYVNGKEVNKAIEMKFYNANASEWNPLTRGRIMIQAEGAEIFYKDIKIKERQ